MTANESAIKGGRIKRTISKIPVRQVINNKRKRKSKKSAPSTSTIVISPEKTKTVNNTTNSQLSDCESDCEIIENITPLIVLDDDCTNEAIEPSALNETGTPIESIAPQTSIDANETSKTDTICDNTIRSNETTQNISMEPCKSVESESESLYFIDKTPGTDFTTPIYELKPTSRTKIVQNMAKNIRITIQNKENHAQLDTSFAPNPLLSSTCVNEMGADDVQENAENAIHSSSNETVTEPTNFCISINSTCENGSMRQVTVNRAVASGPKVSNDNSSNGSKNNTNSPRAMKRKAQKENRDEPASKKRNSESSDVILLNDTMSDDDSVIFVSETLEQQKRNRINNTARGKALDFISLTNGKRNPNNKSPLSTRAKRKQEKKKATQAKKLIKPTGRLNRFGVTQQTNFSNDKFTSFAMPTATTTSPDTTPSTSTTTAKKTDQLEYEKEKKLFAEKPELFEKRMIVIDGSNVAFAHGLKNRSYSIKGIEICIKYFEDRGFQVRAVVPQMRWKRNMSTDPDALERLQNAGKIVKTPCKNLPGQRSSCYDDRFILEVSQVKDAAIISNDNYADLLNECNEWTEIIKERVVGFSWCDDFFMIPQDPYGKNGRTLQLILHKLKKDAQIVADTPDEQ